jgi:hypothetical protein
VLRSCRRITGSELATVEGVLGRIADVYLDNHRWVIRYLEVAVSPHRLLIPVQALGKSDFSLRLFETPFLKNYLMESPCVARREQITADWEAKLLKHFRWRPYWEGSNLWVDSDVPRVQSLCLDEPDEPPQRPHALIRSSDIVGTEARTNDGSQARIADLLVDQSTWGTVVMIVSVDDKQPRRVVAPIEALEPFADSVQLKVSHLDPAGDAPAGDDRIVPH